MQLDQGVMRNKNAVEELHMLRQEIRGKEEQIAEVKGEANKMLKVSIYCKYLFKRADRNVCR